MPINTAGIIRKEKIGKNIKLPIIPYVGIAPKCIATNGAVNMVAVNVVKIVAQEIFNNLLCGIFGFTTVYIHTNPNTAANDSWNPACITLCGFIKNIIQNTNATLRKEITLRPIANAMNISVVIKNARSVAMSPPDKIK